jgi:hypothetical protein
MIKLWILLISNCRWYCKEKICRAHLFALFFTTKYTGRGMNLAEKANLTIPEYSVQGELILFQEGSLKYRETLLINSLIDFKVDKKILLLKNADIKVS